MRYIFTAVLLSACVSAAPGRAETLLHVADTETVTVAPDELAASLRAEASSANAVEAQQRVNNTMTDALARARAVAGVTVSTGGYGVWHIGPTPQDRTEQWRASQSLELKSHDGVALLKLVGALQQNGLVTGQLGWQLSPGARRKAHDEATRQALTVLREKAEEAAKLLDLRVDSFKQVTLGATQPPPVPRMLAMATSSAAAPPNAVAEDMPVSATVEADVILLTK